MDLKKENEKEKENMENKKQTENQKKGSKPLEASKTTRKLPQTEISFRGMSPGMV